MTEELENKEGLSEQSENNRDGYSSAGHSYYERSYNSTGRPQRPRIQSQRAYGIDRENNTEEGGFRPEGFGSNLQGNTGAERQGAIAHAQTAMAITIKIAKVVIKIANKVAIAHVTITAKVKKVAIKVVEAITTVRVVIKIAHNKVVIVHATTMGKNKKAVIQIANKVVIAHATTTAKVKKVAIKVVEAIITIVKEVTTIVKEVTTIVAATTIVKAVAIKIVVAITTIVKEVTTTIVAVMDNKVAIANIVPITTQMQNIRSKSA